MPQDYKKIHNSLERRATLIVEMLEDSAQAIVDTLDEPPPGTQEPDTETVRRMWQFTPFGARAPQAFWGLHDLALEKLMGEISAMPDLPAAERVKMIRSAHQKAEMTALQKCYPHRASLILLGITTPERSVQLAERARRLAEQDEDKSSAPAQVEEAVY
jgi:hypothetical protein